MSKEEVCSDTSLLTPEFQIIVSDIMNLLVVKHNLPMAIFETKRSQERQQWLFDQGYSKTLKSNHASGNAVDIVVFIDGKWSWADKDLCYYKAAVELVNGKLGDKVVCGGSWAMRDYPHYEKR